MTIQIPDKLKRSEIRFILVQPRDKRPFEMAWILNDIEWVQQEDKSWKNKKTGKIYLIPKTGEVYKGELHSYKYDDPKLLSWLEKNGNYGVCGGNGLMLVDFDDTGVQEKALKLLPDTFTVMTGSKMLHLYFWSDGEESFKGFSETLTTLFDCQGAGKMVIGPGSQHPNMNYYQVLHDHDIAFIKYETLKDLLSSHDQRPVKEKPKQMKRVVVKLEGHEDTFLDDLKNKVTPEVILNHLGIDTTSNPCACPFHESKGGHCLGFDDVTAHCFNCEGSWNAFTLIREKNKCSFKEALEIMVEIAGMQKEYEENKKKFADAMKAYQKKYIEDLKKKDQEAADKRTGKYKAGKVDVPQQVYDIEGNLVDVIKDDAKLTLLKKSKPQNKEEQPIIPKPFEKGKKEKNKTLKFNEEENPFK